MLRILSGIGRGWGSNYNCVLLRSSLREMTDLVTLIDSIARPIGARRSLITALMTSTVAYGQRPVLITTSMRGRGSYIRERMTL